MPSRTPLLGPRRAHRPGTPLPPFWGPEELTIQVHHAFTQPPFLWPHTQISCVFPGDSQAAFLGAWLSGSEGAQVIFRDFKAANRVLSLP